MDRDEESWGSGGDTGMQRSANMQAPSERAEGEKPEGEEPEGENGGRGGPPDQIQVDSLLLSVLYFGQ